VYPLRIELGLEDLQFTSLPADHVAVVPENEAEETNQAVRLVTFPHNPSGKGPESQVQRPNERGVLFLTNLRVHTVKLDTKTVPRLPGRFRMLKPSAEVRRASA